MSRTLDSSQPIVTKDPDSVKEPRVLNWTAWLAELGAGVTITASDFVVVSNLDEDATPLEVDEDSIVIGGLKTQLRYSGGTLGAVYTVTNHIVCSDDTEDDRSFRVRVKQR